MRKSRYSEEQIIRVLQEVESGRSVKDVCRDQGISTGTYYSWKSKYGGLDVNEARRLKELETDNLRLKSSGELPRCSPGAAELLPCWCGELGSSS